jgi:hypothetical protein
LIADFLLRKKRVEFAEVIEPLRESAAGFRGENPQEGFGGLFGVQKGLVVHRHRFRFPLAQRVARGRIGAEEGVVDFGIDLEISRGHVDLFALEAIRRLRMSCQSGVRVSGWSSYPQTTSFKRRGFLQRNRYTRSCNGPWGDPTYESAKIRSDDECLAILP